MRIIEAVFVAVALMLPGCVAHVLQPPGDVKAFGSWLWCIANQCVHCLFDTGRIHGRWPDRLLLL